MNHRVPLLAILFAAIAAGCFQELDTRAASGGASAPASDVTEQKDSTTPPAERDDGTTADPCVSTSRRALAIRQKYCASCHAPPAKMGAFDFVLDDSKLVIAVSSTAMDNEGKPQRFVTPGAPDESRLYTMAAGGKMPPVVAPPLPPNPTPTVSDLSILREWIAGCLGARPAKPPDAGSPVDAGDAG